MAIAYDGDCPTSGGARIESGHDVFFRKGKAVAAGLDPAVSQNQAHISFRKSLTGFQANCFVGRSTP